MRKLIDIIGIICSVALVVLYSLKAYQGENVSAISALLPWALVLLKDISDYGVTRTQYGRS